MIKWDLFPGCKDGLTPHVTNMLHHSNPVKATHHTVISIDAEVMSSNKGLVLSHSVSGGLLHSKSPLATDTRVPSHGSRRPDPAQGSGEEAQAAHEERQHGLSLNTGGGRMGRGPTPAWGPGRQHTEARRGREQSGVTGQSSPPSPLLRVQGPLASTRVVGWMSCAPCEAAGARPTDPGRLPSKARVSGQPGEAGRGAGRA